jgi:hypothetical protein
MMSLGLDAVYFGILHYRYATFFKLFGQLKNCFTPQFLARKSERAVAFHSGQLRFRAGRMQKPGPLWKAPQPIDCFIFTDKKLNELSSGLALPEIWDKMATDMRTLIKYGDQILLKTIWELIKISNFNILCLNISWLPSSIIVATRTSNISKQKSLVLHASSWFLRMLYFYSQFDEFHSVIYSKLVTQEVNIRRINQHPFGGSKVPSSRYI